MKKQGILTKDDKKEVKQSVFVKILFVVSFVLLFCCSMSERAYAASGNCGKGVRWNYDYYTRTLTLSGSGVMEDYSSVYSIPWYEYKDDVEKISVGQGITNIGEYAFRDCKSVTSVELPDSILSIGYYAFGDCTSLTSITIPKKVKTIGTYAFYNCESVTQVVFDAESCSALSIGSFENMGGNTQGVVVLFGNSVKRIPESLFYTYSSYNAGNGTYSHIKAIKMSGTIKEIGQNAFKNCFDLENVLWGNNIETIGSDAFNNCIKLKNITIPEKVKTIGGYAFEGCESVTNITFSAKSCSDCEYYSPFGNVGGNTQGVTVTFGSKVKRIPAYLFYTSSSFDAGNGNYAHVKTVKMSNTIKEIGTRSFRNCYDLVNVLWGSNIETIGSDAFNNCIKLKNITIPEKVKTIGGYAFEDCESVTNITFSAESCSDCKYYSTFGNVGGNTQGVTVTFGSKVKRIPEYLFYTNSSYDAGNGSYAHIKAIHMSASVQTIGSRAFQNCYDLNSIVLPINLKRLGDAVFDGCDKIIIYALKGNYRYRIDRYYLDGTGTVAVNAPRNKNISTAKVGDTVTIAGVKFRITIISKKAFQNAGRLKTVILGNNVSVLGENCFSSCKELTSITIGTNLSKINANAFKSSGQLKNVVIKSKKLKIIGGSAFSGINSKAVIKVPYSKLKQYKKLMKGKGQGKEVKITKL